MKRLLLSWLLMLLLAVAVFPQLEGNPENYCRNGFFPRESESYSLGTVKGKRGQRVYFHGDDGDCPGGARCRTKQYLIPGDEVIVSRTFGKFACVWFQPQKGSETVGWIPLLSVEQQKIVWDGNIADLVGDWNFYENSIGIAKSSKPDRLRITGNAFWKGLGDNIHIGELDGEAKVGGATMRYGFESDGEYDCRVTMRYLPGYLIVADNLNCGGANVTFSGVYRKKTR